MNHTSRLFSRARGCTDRSGSDSGADVEEVFPARARGCTVRRDRNVSVTPIVEGGVPRARGDVLSRTRGSQPSTRCSCPLRARGCTGLECIIEHTHAGRVFPSRAGDVPSANSVLLTRCRCSPRAGMYRTRSSSGSPSPCVPACAGMYGRAPLRALGRVWVEFSAPILYATPRSRSFRVSLVTASTDSWSDCFRPRVAFLASAFLCLSFAASAKNMPQKPSSRAAAVTKPLLSHGPSKSAAFAKEAR